MLQTHPWNVAMHYAWLENTGALKGAKNSGGRRKSAYTRPGLLRRRDARCSPSWPRGNYSSLKCCWGALGVAGRVSQSARLRVCVCSKPEVGGLPQMSAPQRARAAQHTSTTRPDLRPLHPCRTKTTRRREAVAASHTSKSLTSFPTAQSHSHLWGGKRQPGIQWGATYDCNRRRPGRTIFTIRCANEQEGTIKGVECTCNTFYSTPPPP